MLTALCSIGTGVLWNGLPFIAEHDYDFDKLKTLVLSMFLGVVYFGGAFAAGRVIRTVESFAAPRTVLGWIVILQAGVCLGPWMFSDEWMIWTVTGLTALLSAFLWPLVESYLSAGRHGRDMRVAIGWWNIVWTICVALALVLMAPLMREGTTTARFAIVGLGGLNALAALTLLGFHRRPPEHEESASRVHVGREYSTLLHSARVLLPTSYVLLALISPLMPYRLDDLRLESEWQTPLTATWMLARVGVIVIMWRFHFWHGRWGTLLLGGLILVTGFAAIVFAQSVLMMLVGLALFGIGQGVTYFAAIYYALSVGRARVDASGTHEGLIGVGYAVGPIVGIAGILLAKYSGVNLSEASAIVLVAGVILAAALAGALRPYFRARHARAETGLRSGD